VLVILEKQVDQHGKAKQNPPDVYHDYDFHRAPSYFGRPWATANNRGNLDCGSALFVGEQPKTS
jgi:hypothetical protein